MVSSSFLRGKLLRSVLHVSSGIRAMCPNRDRRLDWTMAERWGCLVNGIINCLLNYSLWALASMVSGESWRSASCPGIVSSYMTALRWISCKESSIHASFLHRTTPPVPCTVLHTRLVLDIHRWQNSAFGQKVKCHENSERKFRKIESAQTQHDQRQVSGRGRGSRPTRIMN